MKFKDILTLIKEKYTVRSARWMQKHFASLFDQVADPVIRLNPEDVICLQITIYSYYPPEKRPPTIGDYQLENLFPHDNSLCVYVNHTTQDLIIGFKGTDIMNMHDILSDVQLIFGVSGLDKRVGRALHNFDKVRMKYPEYTKQICGHSLGGTICYIIAKHRELERCTVFNPGYSPNPLFIQMLSDTVQKALWTTRVYTYKILGDMVSSFSYVGNTKLFRVHALDPYYLHNLIHFVPPDVEYIPLEGFFPPPQKEHL